MTAVRGITVSVGYGDLLAITLPRNMRHLVECLVVTSPEDERTQAVARSIPGVRLHVTDAHRRHGARFNKGLCMQEGFDVLGRDGWILIHDADCLFPERLSLNRLNPEVLYGARRLILPDPSQWRADLDWSTCEVSRDGAPIGFFQLFRADAPTVRDKPVWYDVSFGHAGGCDAFFLSLWPQPNVALLPLTVLHLGRVDYNWFGVDQEGHDIMAKYATDYRMMRSLTNFDPDAAQRAGEFITRVEVPGYPPSEFELPLERRAKESGGPAP
jgi:hypothetical protein